MKYLLNGTWVNDDTIEVLPEGAILLTETEWDNRHSNYVPTLEQAKANKLQELETAFISASRLPVEVGTKTYNGGEESVIAIKNYIEYGIKKGLTEYHIWDINNDKVAYTLTQAQGIELAIADTVVSNNFKLNDKKVAVKVATTIEAINLVVW